MARPTDLTNELAQKIARLVRQGGYVTVAGETCGVSRRTISGWLARGRKEAGSIFEQFLHLIQEAEARAEMKMIRVVRTAALKDPKYACWFLAHKFPRRWSEQRGELKDLTKKYAELEKRLASK